MERISDPTLPGFPSVNDEGWSISVGGNIVYMADGSVIWMICPGTYSEAYASGVRVFEGLLVNRMAKTVAMAVSRRQQAQLAYEAAKKELESCR